MPGGQTPLPLSGAKRSGVGAGPARCRAAPPSGAGWAAPDRVTADAGARGSVVARAVVPQLRARFADSGLNPGPLPGRRRVPHGIEPAQLPPQLPARSASTLRIGRRRSAPLRQMYAGFRWRRGVRRPRNQQRAQYCGGEARAIHQLLHRYRVEPPTGARWSVGRVGSLDNGSVAAVVPFRRASRRRRGYARPRRSSTRRTAQAATTEPSAIVANAALHPAGSVPPPNRSSAIPAATGPANAAR